MIPKPYIVVKNNKEKQKKLFFLLLFALAFPCRGRVRPSLGRLAPLIGKYQGSLSGGVAASTAPPPQLPTPASPEAPLLKMRWGGHRGCLGSHFSLCPLFCQLTGAF